MRQRACAFFIFLLAVVLVWHPLAGHARPNDDSAHAKARVRIELTGGDDERPIPDASVYLKFQTDPKAKKGKRVELNLKTNQEGVALSPEIPQGTILIQVIAPGWKTYGQEHTIDEAEKTISIHLARPTTHYY